MALREVRLRRVSAQAARLSPARRVPLTWGLALLGGLTCGLPVLDTAFAPLAWIGTLPWLLIAVHPALQGRGNLLALCAGLHLMSLIGIEWLRGHSVEAWMIAPLLYWPLALPAYVLVRAIGRRFPALPLAVVWPVVHVGVEWLRVRVSPGELAACVLAHSQIGLPRLAQAADLAGVAAITFLLAAFTGLCAEIVLSMTAPRGSPAAIPRRRLIVQASGVALLLLGALGYGTWRIDESVFTAGPRIHVVQPNTPRPADREQAARIQDLQVLQTLSTARVDSDLVVWPENSITVPYSTLEEGLLPEFIPDLQRVARQLGQPLLVDGWREVAGGGSEHAVMLVRPDGTTQSHAKVRLLPWTEVVPGQRLIGALGDAPLRAWERLIGRFAGIVPRGVPGSLDALVPLTFRGRDGTEWRFGVPLCFEIATARVVNRWHRQGVDFLVNPTSEGRLGDSVHETTLAISGFRAIEGRVSVVRAGNDGISALIDPHGRLREVLRGRTTGSPINEAGAFWPRVLLDPRRPTLYVRMGDSFAIACLAVSCLLGAAAATGRLRELRARPEPGPGLAPAPQPAPRLASVPRLEQDGDEAP